MLYGRRGELSVVDRLLAQARAGRSGALVVRGEPGIGKTALLDHAAAAAAAPGMAAVRVLRGAGIQPEAELPFAGLHLLLGPALERRLALPQLQRDALDAAFGLRRAGSYDRFLIGVAVLSLLAELAEDGPLACLVDDAHWLDRASAEALVFAARRLGAEGVAMVFAARDHDAPFPAQGLPELRISGLDPSAAATLLAAHGGAGLRPAIRDRILAEACGNPLGIIELAAAHLGAAPAAAAPGAALALTDRLQAAFDGQVRRLPEPTRILLLVAAAEGGGDLGVVLEAAKALGGAVAASGPAEQARLVHAVDGTLRFRHPLVRAAVYQGAPLDRRLAVHRALAAALRSPADADRRAWHLAAAATGPDEEVAAELERTAAKAWARSGPAAAATAYERAAQLTMDAAAQAGRLTLAAEAAAEVGDYDRARGLATRALGQTTDPTTRSRLTRVCALADFAQGELASAHHLLVEGAATAGGRDRATAMRMRMQAAHIAWLFGDPALICDTDNQMVPEGADAEPPAPLVQLMRWSGAQATERPTDALPPLAGTVAAARQAHAGHSEDLGMIAMLCLVTGRNPDARELLAALVAEARAHGRIGQLPALLTCLAQALLFDGQHRDALASADEALRFAQDIGHLQWAAEATEIMAYLAAIDGDQERCRRLLDAALAEASTHANSAGRPWAHWTLGLLDLGRGRLDTALVQLETVARGPMRYHASALRSIPDLVEVAARLGQPERVAEPLARFRRWARHAGTPGNDALVERCQALVGNDDSEQHYLAALELHEASFEQARTQLLYGAWLRRARRKADARAQLRAAVDYLDRIDAAPWAERARAELRATGAATQRPGRDGQPQLTPQELQVARLAAQGLSNRDIAAQLFLSPRTVGYHLYKAFPKLGITSRSQLDPDLLAP